MDQGVGGSKDRPPTARVGALRPSPGRQSWRPGAPGEGRGSGGRWALAEHRRECTIQDPPPALCQLVHTISSLKPAQTSGYSRHGPCPAVPRCSPSACWHHLHWWFTALFLLCFVLVHDWSDPAVCSSTWKAFCNKEGAARI